MAPELAIEWLGSVPYDAGLALQQEAWQARCEGRTPDRVLLLEHPAVVTCGRGTRPENLLVPADELAARGIGLHEIARGGDVTYHAPGQLVGYLICDLSARDRDVHAHLRRMEAALMAVCEELDVPAKTIPGKTGVFVDAARHDRAGARGSGNERKLASIGVGVRRWVTLHGFALNVTTDLAGFEVIVPCGLEGVEMTSLAVERGEPAGPPGEGALDAQVRAVAETALRRRFEV